MQRSHISNINEANPPATWRSPAMDKAVAQLNIEHYRKLLSAGRYGAFAMAENVCVLSS
jgi:hypothetical protein